MQLQNNNHSYSNSPNFGMAVNIVPQGRKVFLNRIKSEKEVLKLDKLIKGQEKNPHNITISGSDNGLIGFIQEEGRKNVDIHYESEFSELFRSPVAFVKKMCKIADKRNGTVKNVKNNKTDVEKKLLDVMDTCYTPYPPKC